MTIDMTTEAISKTASTETTALGAYSRPYKSRRQRPCDFCRKRKSCCIIEGTLPCKLCRNFKRECTFLEGPVSRPKPQLDENGQKIVVRRRSAPGTKKESLKKEPKVKKKRAARLNSTSMTTGNFTFAANNINAGKILGNTTSSMPLRRFSAPTSGAKEYNIGSSGIEYFDSINENLVLAEASNRDSLIENLHYSLESHNINPGLLAGPNEGEIDMRKNLIGYLGESPMLQLEKNNEYSDAPFFAHLSPVTVENLHQEQPNASQRMFNNSVSSASSSSNFLSSVSVSSLDSPDSPYVGFQSDNIFQPMDDDFKTNSIYNHAIETETLDYFDPYILALDQNNDIKEESQMLSIQLPLQEKQQQRQQIKSEPKLSPIFTLHQKVIFEILDMYGDKLINLYLTYVNPFIPILTNKQIGFFFSEEEHGRKSIISRLKKSKLSLVTAIISCALEYWDLDNELILDQCPPIEEITNMAFELIFSEYETINSVTVQDAYELLQSCLITNIKGSFDFTKLDHLHKVNLVSKVTEIAHLLTCKLNLNMDSVQRLTPTDDESIFRINMWWCFYIEEKWISLLTGRESMITETNFDINVTIQNPIDQTKFSDPHSKCNLYFQEMIKLTIILSEACQKLLNADVDVKHENSTEDEEYEKVFQTYKQAEALELKVLEWKDKLPSSIVLGENKAAHVISDQTRIGAYVNANATLQISYYVTQFAVYKTLLKKFSKTSTTSPGGSSVASKFETKFNILKLKAINISIECFQSLKTMKVQDLNGFWYLFTNFKFIYIANFYIFLHSVVGKTPSILAQQDSAYNNALQYKSTMQKVLIDFKSLLRNRSSKWKIVRLASDLFSRFNESSDFDILEKYGQMSQTPSWTLETPRISVFLDARVLN